MPDLASTDSAQIVDTLDDHLPSTVTGKIAVGKQGITSHRCVDGGIGAVPVYLLTGTRPKLPIAEHVHAAGLFILDPVGC